MKLRTCLLTCLLFLAFALVLGSCGKKEEAPAPPPATSEAPATPESDQAAARPAPAGEPEGEAASTPAETKPETQPEREASTPQITRPAQPAPAKQPVKDPNVFTVRFQTTKGVVDIECHKDWAPLGVARFRELVEAGFYDGARFFRVVPGFVVQFGIAANPTITAKWENSEIQDDPVLQSNMRGTVTFATAGPNTRTTQMFINLADNQRLDAMRFAPIGRVVRGMDVVDSIDSRYGEQPQQPLIEDQGEQYLSAQFPNLDKILSAKVMD